MLFKVSYTHFGKPYTDLIQAESAASALDYLATAVGWWKEVKNPSIAPCSCVDPEYTEREEPDFIAPLGWVTRTSPELPRRYYYKRVDSVYRDYILLRWAATDAQLDRMDESWTEISRLEASKMARAAAKEDTSYYPYEWRADDTYVYPAGWSAILRSSSYNRELLCYHNRLRIADYT